MRLFPAAGLLEGKGPHFLLCEPLKASQSAFYFIGAKWK